MGMVTIAEFLSLISDPLLRRIARDFTLIIISVVITIRHMRRRGQGQPPYGRHGGSAGVICLARAAAVALDDVGAVLALTIRGRLKCPGIDRPDALSPEQPYQHPRIRSCDRTVIVIDRDYVAIDRQ